MNTNNQIENPWVVLPKMSIRPNKITFYNEFVKRNAVEKPKKQKIDNETKKYLDSIGLLSVHLPESNKHNFELSKKASGRIKEKVTWLYNLAKTQTITTSKKKVLYSFKMNFITLTLPAIQRHTTAEITKTCLNQFITECSTRFGMKNYVWRVEFQKNGNLHYHIATDTFIEYWQCRSIWNRCIQKLGYVAEYQKKNLGKTFAEYLKANQVTEKVTFEILKERFGYGCASKWENPNTADVRAVTNSKNISFYIAKYITKKSDEKLNSIVSDREETNTNLRLWFCSRSLSKVDKITMYIEEYRENINTILNEIKAVKPLIYDYCEVFYFNLQEQTNTFKRLFRQILFEYAKNVGYFRAI
jgi:hypothetical protein